MDITCPRARSAIIGRVRISAKVDYAVRAAVELAAAQGSSDGQRPVKAEALARAQDIPLKFLENILQGLRQAGLIESRRGPDGGHLLARPAAEIALADIIRAIDGPLAGVSGRRPEELALHGGQRRADARGLDRRAGEPAARARGGHDRRRRGGRAARARRRADRRTPGPGRSAERGAQARSR